MPSGTAQPNFLPGPPLLRLHEASVSIGGKQILDQLTFEVAEGEHTAILGPNGSGKSSLIKLVTRTLYPRISPRRDLENDPPVTLFGRSRWNVAELRRLLAIVTADMHAILVHDTGLTGQEAVLTGFFASMGLFRHMTVSDSMRQQAAVALAWMEVSHLADRPLAEMSTGEARRVLIARALVREPRAILLDEPTTGLDLVAARRFMQTVERIAESGKTVLLVTHHIEEIPPSIGRVILLNEGKVFRDGPKTEVLTSPVLSRLYNTSIGVKETDGYYSASVLV